MNSNTRISARAFLAAAALAASPSAWSLGLGDATVESYLNQPLRARIDLVTQENDDLASVSAKLASAADYELIGASLEDLSVPVRFTVENIGGDAFLLASSQLPVNNPVVRLIVEVNWSSGRMLREYTLFLDPPTATDEAAPLPRIDQRETVQEPAPVVDEPAPPPVRSEPEPVSETEPTRRQAASPARQPSGDNYGPVASGETLWGIARDWSAGTGLEINKVMIAIQRQNPDAFMNDNINLLKRGAILRMPAVGDVERISSASAYNEVASQEEEFYEQKGMPRAASPTMPLLSEDRAAEDYAYPDPQQPAVEPEPDPVAVEPEPESEIEPESAVEPEPADTAEQTDETAAEPEAEAPAEPVEEEPVMVDQLELVPPSAESGLDSTYGFEESEEDGGAEVASQALRENLARAEEELIAQQQQNEYLEERIRELEAQIEETRNANVADSDMANMEQRLREERQAAQADAVEEPWYKRFGIWLLGLLVAVAAIAGWLVSRRSRDEVDEEAIQEIKDEAEEVLRVLEDSEPPEPKEEAAEVAEALDEPAEEGDAEVEEKPEKPAVVRFGGSQDEADVLDEESSDPEIQLDLARAYISMGDKEAARVILEEVVANGTEEQQAEAQKMLDLM